MLMAKGACSPWLYGGGGNQPAALLPGLWGIHPDVLGDCVCVGRGALSRHRIPQRLQPAEMGLPAPTRHVGAPGTRVSICRRLHKPLNIRANLDQQVLQECANHLLFLSPFLEQIMFIMLIYFTVNSPKRHSCC